MLGGLELRIYIKKWLAWIYNSGKKQSSGNFLCNKSQEFLHFSYFWEMLFPQLSIFVYVVLYCELIIYYLIS